MNPKTEARIKLPRKVIMPYPFKLYLIKPQNVFIATLGIMGMALKVNRIISSLLLSANFFLVFSISSQLSPDIYPI
jgi:hypothetical protein